jgi:ankyrin repeat protein
MNSSQRVDIFFKIQHANQRGDLGTVQRLYDEGKDIESLHINLGPALQDAIQRQHLDVVFFLFLDRANLNKEAQKFLVESKDYSLLERFLDLGWNINKPVSAHEPSPLQYESSPRDCLFLTRPDSPFRT